MDRKTKAIRINLETGSKEDRGMRFLNFYPEQHGYLWIGNGTTCFGFIDNITKFRKLRDGLSVIIAARERARKPKKASKR